jgi:aspartyl/asparaginyl-tRNA synthetase
MVDPRLVAVFGVKAHASGAISKYFLKENFTKMISKNINHCLTKQ